MAGKYDLFATYLLTIPLETADLTLTFQQIEEILGFPLPASAIKYHAWWAFETDPKQSQKQAWQNAGWRVTNVDLSRNQARFQRFTPLPRPKAIPHTGSARLIAESPQGSLISLPMLKIPEITLSLQNPTWKTVFVIPKNSALSKGRHGLYFDIVQAAGAIRNRFGCYSWGSPSSVYYCGSYAQDYVRGRFRSNLHAQIHNYLQNHRVKLTGQKNTNLIVFEKINAALPEEDIVLRVLEFDEVSLGNQIRHFPEFCEDPDLVHTVEQLLITWYRRQGQCQWNRT